MGLIPFIMKCGADLFKVGDEAEEVQEMLKKEFGDRISDLKVEFDDGEVTLAGIVIHKPPEKRRFYSPAI